VASTIERINFDCPINLMLAIISLTAPSKHRADRKLGPMSLNKRVLH
jgi:hypothetical protein